MQLDRVRRGNDDRDAAIGEAREEIDDLLLEEQTLTPQRFVEENRARGADQRLSQSESLHQTWRKVTDAARRMEVERHLAQRGLDL